MFKIAAITAAIVASCLPPSSGYTARNEACQVMVDTIYLNGANYEDLDTWEYIGHRESNCFLWAHLIGRRDDSVCWFQINYKGSLSEPRTARFGPKELLLTDSNACAKAALSLYAESGWRPWGI